MDKLRTIGWSIIRRWTGLTGGLLNLFVLLAMLNVLDYQTTDILIRLTDYSIEANPALRYMLEVTGTALSILWIKAGILSIAAVVFYWAIWKAKKTGKLIQIKRLLTVCLFGMCVVYGLVVIHNTYGIYRLLSL